MQKTTGQHCYMIIKDLGRSLGYFVFVFAIELASLSVDYLVLHALLENVMVKKTRAEVCCLRCISILN